MNIGGPPRFQQLNQEVEKLGQSPSHTELQILMSSFDNLVQQEGQELTETRKQSAAWYLQCRSPLSRSVSLQYGSATHAAIRMPW